MKKLSIIILLFLIQLPGKASFNTEVDSLKALVPGLSGRERVLLLQQISHKYYYNSPDSSIKYAKAAYRFSDSSEMIDETIESLRIIGVFFRLKASNDSAKKYFQLAYELSETYKKQGKKIEIRIDLIAMEIAEYHYKHALMESLNLLSEAEQIQIDSLVIRLLILMGETYWVIGDYEKSLKTYNKALKISDELPGLKWEARILKYKGIMYMNFDSLDLALTCYRASHKLYKELKDPKDIGDSYYKIAEAFLYKNELDSSIINLEESLKWFEKENNIINKSHVLTMIARIHFLSGNMAKCIQYGKEALEYRERYGNESLISSAYINLGESYLGSGNTKKALDLINKGLKIAEVGSFVRYARNGYRNLYEAYLKNGQFREALHHYKLYTVYRDSLIFEKNSEIIAAIIYKHELDQQEKEIILLNNQKKLRGNLAIMLGVILILSLGVIYLVFFRYKASRRLYLKLKAQNHTIIYQKEQINWNLKELKESEQQLQQANMAKDKFFSIVAHDLKSPFNGILGFLNLLQDNYDNFNEDERKKIIRDVKVSSENTYQFIENLLEWARTQNGTIEYKPTRYELTEPILSTLEIIRPMALKKGVSIIPIIEEGVDVYGDIELNKTVLRNLLTNAVKFTTRGGKIHIRSETKNGIAVICVEDNGMGIQEELQKDLFEPGKQIKRQGTENEKGTGLGLLICKEFVEMNKGKIWFESIPDKGSKFYFTLPLD